MYYARFILLAFILNLWPIVTLSAETSSKEYGISFTSSDRWTHKVVENEGKYLRVVIKDAREQANVMITATFRPRLKNQPSIRNWMENEVVPNNLKSYSSIYQYHISTERRRQVTLGNGLEATVLEYLLVINGNSRSIVFLYWERDIGQGPVWYWVQINNYGLYFDLHGSAVFEEIITGIR